MEISYFSKEYYERSKQQLKALRPHFKILELPPEKEEDFKVDVIVTHKNELFCYLELETKGHWKGSASDFQFDSVNFLHSKLKYTNMNKKAYWILFNSDHTEVCYIDIDLIMPNDVFEEITKDRGIQKLVRIPINQMTWGIHKLEDWIIKQWWKDEG